MNHMSVPGIVRATGVAALVALWAMAARTAGAAEDFVVKDEARFRKIVPAGAGVERVAGGFKFTEGPQWFDGAEGGYLLFSDIPPGRIYRWRVGMKAPEVFREPSNNANGNTRDGAGRLITCEHSSRRVTRTATDGAVTVLAERFGGKRLNSPNDAVVKRDGAIYFTDPPYGIKAPDKEQEKNRVYRIDPKSGELTAVADDLEMPNGLCFSPDEKRLYVADSGRARHVRVYDVGADGMPGNGRVFCTIDVGVPDGIRCDVAGRLFSSAGDGVHVFGADGALIGKILTPEVADPRKAGAKRRESCANLAFGGPKGTTLFMTAQTSVYAVELTTRGAAGPGR